MEELRERENARDMEIKDLKELLHSALVTINKLSDRVSLLEEQVTLLRNTPSGQPLNPSLQETSSSSPQPEGTLLLGDTNLSPVRSSDLGSNCSVRTIKGANIDLLKCWISEKLQWVPRNCILYCGLQDILDKSTSCDIFDKLGSLVTELKQVNENMNIHICELAPIPNACDYDEHINNFNNQVATWSTNNGVSVIRTNLQFRLGTGEVDYMCFNDTSESENNFLNRFGIIRLLNVISKQFSSLELHENWEIIMSQGMPSSTYSNQQKINFNENNPKKTDYIANRYLQSQRIDVRGRQNSGLSGRQFYSQTNTWQNENSYEPTHFQRRWHTQPNKEGYRSKCYNCGEHNHRQNSCRFDHRLKCGNCGTLGHKSKMCTNNY